VKVFISQSLPRSNELAQALAKFVEKVIPGTKPWVSSTGIDKGARFNDEIRNSLSDATGGIVCLTRENLMEPWILYEAGALSTKVADRLWTFLLDVEFTEVADPLKVINHTRAEKADVLKMMKSMQKIGAGSKDFVCTEAMVDEYFEAFWPKLKEKIEELQKTTVAPATTPQPIDQVLSLVQLIGQHVSRISWREEKSLAMLHRIYAVTVGAPVPSLKELKEQGTSFAEARLTRLFRNARSRVENQALVDALMKSPQVASAFGEGTAAEDKEHVVRQALQWLMDHDSIAGRVKEDTSKKPEPKE
jgi:hypothetical protein